MFIEVWARRAARIAALPPMLILISCASLSREDALAPAGAEVEARLGANVAWSYSEGGAESGDLAAALDALLAAPLSAETAVRIALLNNRELAAEFEEIGLARADFIEAALPHNPTASGVWKFPESGPSGTSFEFEIAQEIFGLAALPARRKIARANLEAAQFEAAEKALDLAARTRSAYFHLQAEMQQAAVLEKIAEAAEASAELAERFESAGNMSELELSMRRDEREAARLDLARAAASVRAAREDFMRLMGLWGERAAWTIPAELPAIPTEEAALVHLESLAVERRADLAQAKKENEAAARALAHAKNWRLFSNLEAGAGGERELDGLWLLGPALAFELPIYNRRQAEIARLGARLAQTEHRLYALAVKARSEARAARDRMLAAREEAERFRSSVIPLRERIVALTQENYNFMLVGAFELISARKNEFEAYRSYIAAVRDYWIARGDLERAIGGRLAGGEAEGTVKIEKENEKAGEHEHHDHEGEK